MEKVKYKSINEVQGIPKVHRNPEHTGCPEHFDYEVRFHLQFLTEYKNGNQEYSEYQ